MYKFKSMTDERDAAGNLLPDSERLTAMGRFIRKTSIDELPQLWNVLRGYQSYGLQLTRSPFTQTKRLNGRNIAFSYHLA